MTNGVQVVSLVVCGGNCGTSTSGWKSFWL